MKMVLWLSVTSLLLSSITMEVHSLQVQPTPDFNFRLAGGTNHCNGKLQEKKWGEWETVEDKKKVVYKLKAAHELCRQLDCGTAVSAKTIPVEGKWWTIVEVICSESVKLVNGTGSCSGRVEVKSNQSWVSVCEGDFDQQDAEVICRQLGCGTHPILLGALYGEASVPMWNKEFQCEGNESVLLDCRTSDSTRNTCSPDKAVGLTCSGVRLVGGTSHCQGKLEEKPDGEWREVHNDDIWKVMETHQVCRQLDCGLTGKGDFFGFWFQKGYRDVEVTCSDVRLVGGASDCTGVLETKHSGVWGPLTDEYYHFEHFEQRTADEVCRQLDCGSAVSTKLWNTQLQIICSESVRLVDGTSWCSGRVEVKSNQSWVSLCEGDFDQQDAEVVCRQLGCGVPKVLQGAPYGEVNGPHVPMWNKEFLCEGKEFVLLDCRTSNSPRNTCSPDKAVGLTCSDYRLVGAESNCVGHLYERLNEGWRIVRKNDHIWNLMLENQLCRQLDCGSAASGIWFWSKPGVELTCLDFRLVGGTNNCNGILEKKEDGEWVTVRDTYRHFSIKAAHEVCRLLDCGTAVTAERLEDIRGYRVYQSTKVNCSESARLVNGTSSGRFSGRVEVKLNQSWAPVCEGDFGQQEAEVVCRQLGGGSHAVLHGAPYGEVNVPMWTKEFQCEGNESVLLDCRTPNSTRNTCSPDKAVGLTCSEFRLVGGTSNCTGALELELQVEFRKEWRPTFDRYSDWDMKASHVVCRQLGCGHALDTFRRRVSEHHAIWHTISTCRGSESKAEDCIRGSVSSDLTNNVREITCSGPPVQPAPNPRA